MASVPLRKREAESLKRLLFKQHPSVSHGLHSLSWSQSPKPLKPKTETLVPKFGRHEDARKGPMHLKKSTSKPSTVP